MNYAKGDAPYVDGAYIPFLPDGMTSALGGVGFGLIVFTFVYLLISPAMRTGKRRQSPSAPTRTERILIQMAQTSPDLASSQRPSELLKWAQGVLAKPNLTEKVRRRFQSVERKAKLALKMRRALL